MQEGAKRRLVGAVVIVALAVILVPMLFEDASLVPQQEQALLPDEPRFEDILDSDYGITLPEQLAEDDIGLASEGESLPLALSEPDIGVNPTVIEQQPGQLGAERSAPRVAAPVVAEPPATPQRRPPPERPSTPPPRQEAAVTQPPPRERNDAVPSWIVQVASLGSSESAEGLASKLQSAGFTAFVEQAEVRGKRYYRVRVGPETDRKSVERTAEKLKQQKMDTLIQRYQ